MVYLNWNLYNLGVHLNSIMTQLVQVISHVTVRSIPLTPTTFQWSTIDGESGELDNCQSCSLVSIIGYKRAVLIRQELEVDNVSKVLQ